MCLVVSVFFIVEVVQLQGHVCNVSVQVLGDVCVSTELLLVQ